ncbi:MAG: AlkA N-terminal domain-containing protein [Vicinamibacterales bacterium]
MDLDPRSCYRALCGRDARFDGRLFVGVRTTGVYCRPICPARTPKREHVQFFPTAAAAQEAGFRPCLRCRPETAPDLAAWRGTSNTVARALALIERGGLDEDMVDGLAGRLGIGERQLRRLFRQHLGASPIAVAQTRRVLLAKQLIHDTSLAMSEIALAAGFGSIRRFNETFQHLYHRPPSELRRSMRAARSPGGEEVTLRLPYRRPYDWEAMLAFLRARAIQGLEAVDEEGYTRTFALEGTHGVLRVRPAAGDALAVTVRCARLSALPSVIARVRRLFDLSADPEVIGAQLSEDPRLARLVAARPGLRVPGGWDGFEVGVRAVLGQQITVTAAAKLGAVLLRTCGEPLALASGDAGGLTHVFPTPASVAALDPALLPMPRARARALVGLARTVADDPRVFGAGRTLDEVVARLRRIDGIGPWTAQYVAMRELHEPDAFPAGDVGLRRALAGHDGPRPTAAELERYAERWRPWRAYAAQYLWTTAGAGTPPSRESAHRARRTSSSARGTRRRPPGTAVR